MMNRRLEVSLALPALLMGVMTVASSCLQGDPPIPSGFTTYHDKSDTYTISYPHQWEADLSRTQELEIASKIAVSGTQSDAPVGRTAIVFFAGQKNAAGFDPNLSVVTDILPGPGYTAEAYAQANLPLIRKSVPDFKELSHKRQFLGGKEALVQEWEGTVTGSKQKRRSVQVTMILGDRAWVATCGAAVDVFDKNRDDIRAAALSLRLLP